MGVFVKFTLLLFLFVCLHPFARANEAQKIVVKLENKKTVACNLDNDSQIYICAEDEPNPVLVKKNIFGFFALGKDEQAQTKSLRVTGVEAEGKVVFNSVDPGGFPGVSEKDIPADFSFKTDLTQNLSKIYNEKVMAVDEFFKTFVEENGIYKHVRLKGSEKFERIAQPIIQEVQQTQDQIKNAFSSKNYSLELEDGQTIHCERGNTKPLSAEQKQMQEISGYKVLCGSFKCDQVTVNGKKYDSTLLYESMPGSFATGSIYLTDKDGAGPKISIKKISSDLSPTPLVDNTYLLQNGNSTYYGSYMKSMIPASISNQEERQKIASFKDPTTTMLLNYHKMLCEDNEALDKIFAARNKAVSRLAELELAEFIQVLANGSLVGSYIDPTLAPELGCLYQGVYLNAEAEKNLARLKKNIHPDRQVDQTISLDRATELFNKAAAMKDIAWKYKPDGCYARAHLMARRFEAEGVRVDKVWIKGDLYVPGTPINWNFHVAPIVYVEKNGKVEKMVIDPSLFDKPVTVAEWDQKMSKKTIKGSVVTAFPFPENSAFMERSTLSFSSSDPYLPRDSIEMTEEQKMNQANTTMRTYKTMEPQ